MTKVLEFSVRTSAEKSLDQVLHSVEKALNLTFTEGEFEEGPAYIAKSLGMSIGLFRWGEDYLLETRIEDPRFLEAAEENPLEVARISETVADVLTVLGPSPWRVTTDTDHVKDREVGDKLDRQFTDDAGPPPWAEYV
ncbi:hypothetical protein ACIREM_26970 [Streptomyces shenzhenensis]|uniref:hypothetical protein n=1 Tax=Streptomyces shenzhenensis TaxID=943815 RepID=UPI00381C2C69